MKTIRAGGPDCPCHRRYGPLGGMTAKQSRAALRRTAKAATADVAEFLKKFKAVQKRTAKSKLVTMKTKHTKKLEKEIAELHCEVTRLKRIHCEYLRLHNDIPEKIAGVLRRIKALYSQSTKV